MADFSRRILRQARTADFAISASQCLALGATRNWLGRQVSSGKWQRLHAGVFVVHSGPLSWRTRAAAGLLYSGPGAALSHAAAAHVFGFLAKPPAQIDIVVPHGRKVVQSPGLKIRRRRQMPRVFGELAVVEPASATLDLISVARDDDDAFGVLAAAVQANVSPQRILEELATRTKFPRRRLVLQMLELANIGVESPLEAAYHVDVERRHGLPRSRLQVRQHIGGRWTRADGRYEKYRVRVELDGELAHPGGRTDQDTWRDNAALIELGEVTLRYRWRHVKFAPCETASQVARALRAGGWRGRPKKCGPKCTVAI